MNKLLYILLFLLFTFQAQAQTELSGRFLENSILNQYLTSDSATKGNFKTTLSGLNISTIETYLDLLTRFQFQQADSLKESDPVIKDQSERMVAILYTYYYANINGLIDLHCLTLTDDQSGKNLVIFMSESNYKRFRNRTTTLKVQLIQDLPRTKTRLLRLIE